MVLTFIPLYKDYI